MGVHDYVEGTSSLLILYFSSPSQVSARLRVGVHEDVEVTSYHWGCNLLRDPEQLVTQVFTSVSLPQRLDGGLH